jgi:hypothetical protein
METWTYMRCLSVSRAILQIATPVRKRVDVHHPHVFLCADLSAKKDSRKATANRDNKGETGVYWPSVDDITIMDDNSRF